MLANCAILRSPGKSIVNGLSQEHQHEKPNYERAIDQHRHYKEAMHNMGIFPLVCDSKEEFPDSCFVEDTHLILPEVTVRLNPGTPSRAQEGESLFHVLPQDRPFKRIPEDCKIDGGDILVSEKRIYIGLSTRTQQKAITTLKSIVHEYGYQVVEVNVPEGLHLKSGMTLVKKNVFIVQKPFYEVLKSLHEQLGDTAEHQYFIVPPEENFAANVLAVNEKIMIPTNCPKTKEFILKFYSKEHILEVDTSEFRKVDGALTCLSIPFQTDLLRYKNGI